ncbi:hypothetical protein GCM10010185_53440 [Saccharothrix coeruleofusca]|uniref:Uncharacterized protein n=1 Tax=Saccharothrix coeruleofusca TaxID=33919 RepID=A0A918ATB0_9PSEU|nr:hypothetical protein GCM10010185_53440 [Saccharothrix coeruleofusca]
MPLGLLLATACGARSDAGAVCTGIGVPVGIGVDVALPDVVAAEIEVCWDGACVRPPLELFPSSRVAGTTCAGTAPDDVCAARSEPSGGKHGFASVPELPAEPVVVTLRLSDQSGTRVLDERISLTPAMVLPNGPDCPSGGPQAGVSITSDGVTVAR